jgi:dipeptidyl aminopeptidase/acylaminoacyl peptidase
MTYRIKAFTPVRTTIMDRLAFLWTALFLATLPGVVFAEGKRPMKLEDLFKFKRVSDPQISPDGKWVVYAVGTVDLEGNKIPSALWLAPTDGKGEPRQLTNAPGKKDRHPRWSPDGKQILFESNRSGDTQLWLIGLDGGEARQLTTISTEAGNALWSRDGKQIAFVSAVYPEFSEKPFKESDAVNKKRKEEVEKNPVKAKVFKQLFYRHWDSYVEDKRQHLFVMSLDNGKAGEPKDVTPGDRDAYPTSSTFETGDNYTFSPDGKYLVFTAVPEKGEAWSTNYDLCRVPVTGGTAKWECLTKDNPAADSGPVFAPDGKKLAYRAQKKPGYEADQWVLLVVDVDEGGSFKGTPKPFVKVLQSVDEFAWATVWNRGSASPSLLFAADDKGTRPLFAVAANGDVFIASLGTVGMHGSLSVSADGKRFAFTLSQLSAPNEVYSHGVAEAAGFGAVNLSRANAKLLDELDLPKPESVSVEGAGGAPMQMWILKPPGFDPQKKWPLAYLVHGGPQGAWEDGWSYRWCPELWAAKGTSSPCPTRAARPASDRSTSRRSAATGAASATTTS